MIVSTAAANDDMGKCLPRVRILEAKHVWQHAEQCTCHVSLLHQERKVEDENIFEVNNYSRITCGTGLFLGVQSN